MTPIGSFDLWFVFPAGESGTSLARRRIELAAQEKLFLDVRKQGYEPIVETMRTVWADSANGTCTVLGRKKGIRDVAQG